MNLDGGISVPHNLPPKVTVKSVPWLLLLSQVIGDPIPAQSLSTWMVLASHPFSLSLALGDRVVGCVGSEHKGCGLALHQPRSHCSGDGGRSCAFE